MENVRSAIRNALLTADPISKIKAARQVARDWRLGRLSGDGDVPMPDRPARPAHPELLPPRLMPRRRGGSKHRHKWPCSTRSPISNSSRSTWRLISQGGSARINPLNSQSDFLAIAADEAMHFALLERRLNALGSHLRRLSPRMTDCGKRRSRHVTMCWRGWPLSRWCSKRAGWTSAPSPSAGFQRWETPPRCASSPAYWMTKCAMSLLGQNGSTFCVNRARFPLQIIGKIL
jgi:hypothetical protein